MSLLRGRWPGWAGRVAVVRAVPVWDVVEAVVLALFMSTIALVARSTQPDAHAPGAVGLALLVVCGLALAVRRVYPLPAYVVAVGTAVAYLAAQFAGWPVYVGAFAGLAAWVSAVDEPRRWVPLAVVGGVGVALATGRPEGWAPVPMLSIALAWAAAAVLLDRATRLRRRLAAQEAGRRAVEERLRLARELHDVLSHSLASISLQAGVGLHLVDRRPAQAREALQSIRDISTDALAAARAALSTVRSDAADAPMDVGLAALDGLLDSVRATGVRVDLDASVDAAVVSAPVGVAGYRIVQEGLTNVMRHAGPGARAWVRLARAGNWLEVEVRDDGTGAEIPVGATGHGLRGMEERAAAVGGQVHAGPAAGGGFTVRARLPLGGQR